MLALLCIGLANVPTWYGPVFWGWAWFPSRCLLTLLGIVAGIFTEDNIWFTVAVLMVPVLFVGGREHGRPIDWILGSLSNPLLAPILLYSLVINIGPIVAIYFLLVAVGTSLRRKLVNPIRVSSRLRAAANIQPPSGKEWC